ncbi:MAG: phage portal protein [Oscillospiraceae bacterium]|nr:phage portal protein [Oscillospiraceae bacterium]
MYQDKRTKLYLPDRVRPKASGYSDAGASLYRNALKGFNARSSAPNEDIDWNNYTLRQRSRMLYMSSPLATSAINTNRTKVIGVGLTLKSAIDREILGLSPEAAKQWQKHTEREFALWADRKANCDATGVNDFAGMQQLALISWLMSGDTFVLVKRYEPSNINPYSLRLHIVEADRVRTPTKYGGLRYPGMTDGENPDNHNRIFDGVEVDSNGMAVAYYVHNNYPWQITNRDDDWVRVEAYGEKTHLPNILHIMSSERPDQYRGVSYLAPAIEPILQLNRYINSALTMALIQSYFTAWIIMQSNTDEIPWDSVGGWDDMDVPGAQFTAPARPRTSPDELEMGPGQLRTLKEGEDIKFGNPTMPVPGFDAFVKTFCKLVGAGMGIPYDVLVKEYNSSYSAARAALLDSWEDFRMRRKWFVDDYCQPGYEIWLAEAVARGRIKAPGFFNDPLVRAAWCGARWIGPVQGSLDPLKEAQAAVLQIQHALKTHEQVTREMSGGDWDENVEQLAAENEKLVAAGGGNVNITMNVGDRDSERGETE